MKELFKNSNFVLAEDEDRGKDARFIALCKDREVKTSERWVLAPLSEEEIRTLLDVLQDRFN